MPRRRRRRAATPTPAQFWRMLRAAAREAELARRDVAATRRRIERDEEERRREKAEFDREQAARDRALDDRLNRIAGDGDNRWGQLMEALLGGSLVEVLRDAGMDVERAFPRVRSRIGDVWREYDVVAAGEFDALVVEVKATLRPHDVARFAERIRDFREWRPDLARPRVWGALAYLATHPDAPGAAEAAGFYLIRPVGLRSRLANSDGFEPRQY